MTTSNKLASFAAAAALVASIGGDAHAQDCAPASRLMIALDKSSSMADALEGTPKWDIAVNALGQVADAYQNTIELGLNIFPAAGECSPGAVFVPPAPGTASAIADALVEPPPTGGSWTPMAETLDALLEDPSLADPNYTSSVVLITDGWQYCIPYDPETRFAPVESVERLAAAGITTYIVGFGGGVDTAALNQMAVAAGTERAGCDPDSVDPAGGNNCYHQADSPADLVAALMDVANQIPQDEVCDGLDNDCDGQVDEGVTQACSTACGMGVSACVAGQFADCDAPTPSPEICDGADNDCDGEADEIDDDEPNLCGEQEYCDGSCQPLDPGMAEAGCGCATNTDLGGALGGLLPLLLVGFGLMLGRRRRRRA